MMTRAELAFSALDKDKKGYITAKELMKLTKKLSKQELMSLMSKVNLKQHTKEDIILWDRIMYKQAGAGPSSAHTGIALYFIATLGSILDSQLS